MYDYVIGVGGTGARCLEAITYLAATGLFTRPLYALLIDPDQNNGNLKRTERLINNYHRLQQCPQPSQPTGSGTLGIVRKALEGPVAFKAPINHPGQGDRTQSPISWRNPNLPSRTFEKAINFTEQTTDFQDFLRLFYQESDLGMPLNIGYRGRTSIGAVALKLDFNDTVGQDGGGLHELVLNLQGDLQNGNPRVFILGSVFGGTGAAALPTIPAFINHLDASLIGPNVERLRFGCAMLIPYFSFPKGPAVNSNGPAPDSDEHMIATQAALLHYAHQQPAYEHVYLVGAPEQFRTAEDYEPGDESQANSPHYVECISALAALDFFSRGEDDMGGQLHFANDVAIVESQPVPRGIFWDSLPATGQRQEAVKRRLIAFTTFAYFYKNFLHLAFVDRRGHAEAPWYKDNFRTPLSLSTRRHELNALYEFCDSYLAWLHALGVSGGSAIGSMFRWEALLHKATPLCAEYLGHLSEAETGPPRHTHDGYHQILKRMDALVMEKPGTQNPVGLLIYLLYHAVEKFCADNYKWS